MLGKVFNTLSSGVSSPSQWLVDWIRGGPESASGAQVTIRSALGYPPIWYAVRKIAGHVGMMPINLHRRLERGSEHAATHPLYRLMRERPNQYQTASAFWETMVLHALLTGNGRAGIIRENGVPVELLPLLPTTTHTCLVNGEKWHIVTSSDAERCSWVAGGPGEFRDGKIYKIRDEDVLHVLGISYNGYSGLSLVDVCRDAVGLGIAGQTAASKSFANGSRPGVVIEAPMGMFRDDKAAKEFIDSFNEYHTGPDNASRAALIREGMKLSTISMSAQDAEWLGQRQHQAIEVAMLLGLETIPGDPKGSSYNSSEQKNLAYLQNCLSPLLTKIEQECNWKLLNNRLQRTHFFNFDESSLLRTDIKTKVETLSMGITARIWSPNEAREKLGYTPYEGGDEYANPAITPGEGEGESADDDQMSPEDANRQAIVTHLRHIIGVEAKKVLAAAGNKNDYAGWVAHFYTKQWPKTLTRAVTDMGGTSELVGDYLSRSQSELTELAGTVAPDGLADAVSELVSQWPERADQLADKILQGELTDAA